MDRDAAREVGHEQMTVISALQVSSDHHVTHSTSLRVLSSCHTFSYPHLTRILPCHVAHHQDRDA